MLIPVLSPPYTVPMYVPMSLDNYREFKTQNNYLFGESLTSQCFFSGHKASPKISPSSHNKLQLHERKPLNIFSKWNMVAIAGNEYQACHDRTRTSDATCDKAPGYTTRSLNYDQLRHIKGMTDLEFDWNHVPTLFVRTSGRTPSVFSFLI